MSLDTRLTASRITHLALTDFRNYSTLAVELHSGQNVFVGRNGQGKSNVLEALYAIASTRSFRGARGKEMVRHGCDLARVTAVAGDDDEELALELARVGGKRAFVFGQRLPRPLDLVGRAPAVVFSTTDLSIVDGGPAERRAYLDGELSLLSPSYLQAFAGYRKALEHRNACLRAIREGGAAQDSLLPWDAALSEKGALLRSSRKTWFAALAPMIHAEHADLSGVGEEVQAEIVQSDDAGDVAELAELLRTRRTADLAAGHTTVGPHRDDISLLLNGTEARVYASQGQRRTLALALKLAVARYWQSERGVMPMLLLDDIMSDLDTVRRNAVMAVSGKLGQVVITTTDLDAIRPEVGSDAKVFQVENGEVTPR